MGIRTKGVWTILLLFCMAVCGNAQNDVPLGKDSIRFPGTVTGGNLLPSTTSKITPDKLYVIDSDVSCILLTSPKGKIKITQETGELKIRAKFVDGPDSMETRTFKGKFVYIIEGVETGKVDLFVVPEGSTKESDVITKHLDIMTTGPPKPSPSPVEPVDPPVDPVVRKAAKLKIVICEDNVNRTQEQADVIYDSRFRNWAKSAGHEIELLSTKDPVYLNNGYKKYADINKLPFIVVLDNDGDTKQIPLAAFALPETPDKLLVELGKLVK